MKIFCTKLILLLLCIELVLRGLSFLLPTWYRQAEQEAQKVPVKYVFIGSSRVASSIAPLEFLRALKETDSHVSAINMGAGYSTLVEHYFGLRRLAAAMPNGMKGVTVFLEEPMGVLDLVTWRSNWFYDKNPDLLAQTITLSDLWSFWFKDTSDLNLKVTASAGTLSEMIAMQGNGYRLLGSLKKRLLSRRNDAISEKTDLASSGGIRTDENGVKNARLLAIRLASESIKEERLFSQQRADETVLKSLNDFIVAGGGKLIIYQMPLSSIQQKVYATETALQNRSLAHGLLKSWGIPMLYPGITTNDDDFPDYWHLRKSRSSEYTRSLARAYREL
jgi:hypothetical protein